MINSSIGNIGVEYMRQFSSENLPLMETKVHERPSKGYIGDPPTFPVQYYYYYYYYYSNLFVYTYIHTCIAIQIKAWSKSPVETKVS